MNINTLLPRTSDQINADTICYAVAEAWGITSANLKEKTRKQPVAFARQVAMVLTYELTHLTQEQVVTSYGLTNHTAVIYAAKVVAAAQEDPRVKEIIDNIKEKIA